VPDLVTDFIGAMNRVRPIALVVLLVGVGASWAAGVWSIGVGLAVTTLVLLGPLIAYLKRRVHARPATGAPPTPGTMTFIAIVGTLPALIVGVVCVLASSTHWWVGFPAGVCLGIALADLAFYAAAISVLRTDHDGLTPTTPRR
jgi:uncharacterized membrane protein YhaH (DUF805 family)